MITDGSKYPMRNCKQTMALYQTQQRLHNAASWCGSSEDWTRLHSQIGLEKSVFKMWHLTRTRKLFIDISVKCTTTSSIKRSDIFSIRSHWLFNPSTDVLIPTKVLITFVFLLSVLLSFFFIYFLLGIFIYYFKQLWRWYHWL